jgi:hypothetical protein
MTWAEISQNMWYRMAMNSRNNDINGTNHRQFQLWFHVIMTSWTKS